MAINLTSLSQLGTAARALGGLILVTPQDTGIQAQNFSNFSGDVKRTPDSFFFDYKGEEMVDLASDITDHYIEDNTAIVDQVALRPEEIRLEGFVGELNNVTPRVLEKVQEATEKLTLIDGYLPGLSATALRAYNVAFQAYQTAQVLSDTAVQTWDTLVNDGNVNVITGSETEEELEALRESQKNQTKQQIAFQKFYGYWRNRTLFTIQTPWAIFRNMAIKNLKAVQDRETDTVSSFQINFKIMRFANIETTGPINPANASGRTGDKASPNIDLGTSTPRSTDDISLTSVLGNF